MSIKEDLKELSSKLQSLADKLYDDEEVVKNDFVVGEGVIIGNIKGDDIEVLHGVVDELDLVDENGEHYNHIVTDEGRKFRISLTLGEVRKGTKVIAKEG